jgi:preprotein translocase subunit SecG
LTARWSAALRWTRAIFLILLRTQFNEEIMPILIGLLSAILFLDSVVLILLILLQLPKKEAGAGMAFGGAATDALFGAGSGNALTTITKYSAGIFFAVALLLSILGSHYAGGGGGSDLAAELAKSAPSPVQSGTPQIPAASTNPIAPGGLVPAFPTPAAASNSAPPPAAPPVAPPATPPATGSATPPVAPPVAPPAIVPAAPPAPTPPATNR